MKYSYDTVMLFVEKLKYQVIFYFCYFVTPSARSLARGSRNKEIFKKKNTVCIIDRLAFKTSLMILYAIQNVFIIKSSLSHFFFLNKRSMFEI